MNDKHYIIGKYPEKNDIFDDGFSTCPNCGDNVFIGEPYGSGECKCGANWCWEIYIDADLTIVDWTIGNKNIIHNVEICK